MKKKFLRSKYFKQLNIATTLAAAALALSSLNYYQTFIRVHESLLITLTDATRGFGGDEEFLSVTVAALNTGNRPNAVLHMELFIYSSTLASGWRSASPSRVQGPLVLKPGEVQMLSAATRWEKKLPTEDYLNFPTDDGGRQLVFGAVVSTLDSSGRQFTQRFPVIYVPYGQLGAMTAMPAKHYVNRTGYDGLRNLEIRPDPQIVLRSLRPQ